MFPKTFLEKGKGCNGQTVWSSEIKNTEVNDDIEKQ